MADSKMTDLLKALETLFNAAITVGTISAKKVFLGLQDAPAQASTSQYPYIMIDEGGESTDIDNSNSLDSEVRKYRVVLEFGTYSAKDLRKAMLDVINLSNEARTVIEANQQPLGNDDVDGIVWGVDITPFGWAEDKIFFRGRQVIIEYTMLDDTPDQW